MLISNGIDMRKVFIIEIMSDFRKTLISLGFVFIDSQNEIHASNKSIGVNKLFIFFII